MGENLMEKEIPFEIEPVIKQNNAHSSNLEACGTRGSGYEMI